jgi:beta-galactosidase
MIHKYGDYPPRALALQTTADLHLSWDVPYAPGVLKAVGVRGGEVVRAVEVHTTGAAAKLALSADTLRIRDLPSDVCHVTVQVLDAAGRLVPTADDPITFALQGAGRVRGLDNGRPDSHESYQGNTRQAFNGMALVLLQGAGRQAAGQPATMTLSASAPGLTPAQVTVGVG